MGPIQRTCMNPSYFWSIWLKETQISDVKNFVNVTTRGLRPQQDVTQMGRLIDTP